MNQSAEIGKLAEALSKAQGEMQNAAKDKDNPFYKSSYADLTSVWDACRAPLTKYGLSITQSLNLTQEGKITLITQLMHSSGQWISSCVPVNPVKSDPQALGSAITYMRRFSLAALVGVAPAEASDDADDDGNAASGKSTGVKTPTPIPIPVDSLEKRQKVAACECIKTLAHTLGITDWKAEVYSILGKNDFTQMSVDDLKSVVTRLEKLKIDRGFVK